eukprot:TRINITY_DN1392_c0_g1_i1.p1 TRINITY_DN1392_c0_g1~~TRINITY_DN1392_c0_g1_i1.p1  ORF type:complete len:273 (-),score=73.81 TRINITY_DN1392_c0_g1_i1:148-966(-)
MSDPSKAPHTFPPQGTIPPQGYPQGYPPASYPPQGYPPQGFPPQGYPPQGYPPAGYPPPGFPPAGYPPQGYPPQGFPPAGYPPQGYPPAGYPPAGYPPAGYPPPIQGVAPAQGKASELAPNYEIQFKATKLDNKDLGSLSDPFLVLFARSENAVALGSNSKKEKKAGKKKGKLQSKNWVVVHKTEVVDNNLSPVWKSFQVNSQKLCRGLLDYPILVECYDFDAHQSHELIGRVQLTMRELLSLNEFKLKNPNRIGLSDTAGHLHCVKCTPLP